MKTRIGALCLTLLMMLTLVAPMVPLAAAAKAVPVSSVTVSPGSVSLKVGESKKLTATVKPVGKVSQKVTYKSSKTSIATVSSAGVIKAKKAGTAKITVTSKANKKKSKTITVKVTAKPKAKLRVLAVGNYNYRMDALKGPYYDVQNMAVLYRASKLGGKAPTKVNVKTNRTVAQIKSDINSTFKGATSSDVSVFYYSGHGLANRNATADFSIAGVEFDGYTGFYRIKNLRAQLQKIPGTVVVIMDSCFSGAFPAGKSAQATMSEFNRMVISEFGASSKGISSKFKVLTACRYNQISHEFQNTSSGYAYGLFTQAILESVVSWNSSGQAMLSLPCDSNKNKIVELKELYKSSKTMIDNLLAAIRKSGRQIESADVQVFPSNSSFAVFDYR